MVCSTVVVYVFFTDYLSVDLRKALFDDENILNALCDATENQAARDLFLRIAEELWEGKQDLRMFTRYLLIRGLAQNGIVFLRLRPLLH